MKMLPPHSLLPSPFDFYKNVDVHQETGKKTSLDNFISMLTLVDLVSAHALIKQKKTVKQRTQNKIFRFQ